MFDLRWERWLDDAAAACTSAVYRPELTLEERLAAAGRYQELLTTLRGAPEGGTDYLARQITAADTPRRNAAARLLSELGDDGDLQALIACYLDTERQWLSPSHLVRAARRVPLDPGLVHALPDAVPAVQHALVLGLLAHPRPEAEWLFERLVRGPDPLLAEVAVEAVARWPDEGRLWRLLQRIDSVDGHPPGQVRAGVRAARELALRGQRVALDWLEEHTLDSDDEVAGAAHVALAHLAWPGCLAELVELLDVAQGEALHLCLEAADALAVGLLVPCLCDLILRTAEQGGPGFDDNPADRAIRVLEHLTGRWMPAEFCSYDLHGNLDHTSRRRAALLFRAVSWELEPMQRYREGQPLTRLHLLQDLAGTRAPRMARASSQLQVLTGTGHGFEVRDDLAGNVAAVLAWRTEVAQGPDLEQTWHPDRRGGTA